MQKEAVKDRKKRVQRLKRLILCVLAAVVLIPTALSICLGIWVFRLKTEVGSLKQQLQASATAGNTDAGNETQTVGDGMTQDGAADGSTAGAASQVEADLDDTIELTEQDSIRAWENMEKPEGDFVPAGGSIRKVYLTFDDGPSMYTDDILDILKEYNVKATFFVVGKNKAPYEDMSRRIVEEGHTLGMHSYTHVYSDIYSSKEAFVKDVNELQDYLHEVTGVYPQVYRFPGGSSNRAGRTNMAELEAYLDEIGVRWYDWNISSGDATAKLSSAQVLRNSIAHIKEYKSAMILLHDSPGKKSTVEALPEMIETILAMEDTVIVPITEDTVPIQHGKH